MEAGVHALSAGRAVDVGGVTDKEAAFGLDPIGEAVMGAKPSKPRGVAQCERKSGALADDVRQFFEADAFFGVGSAEFGHDAELVLAEGEEGEESVGVVKEGELILGEWAGDFDIGEAEEVGVGGALEVEAEGMADGAVGAIATDDVVVADFANDAFGVLDAGANGFGFGVKFEELGRAFDGATEADELGFEK